MTDARSFEAEWPHRQYWYDPNLDSTSGYKFDGLRQTVPGNTANLVSSRTRDGLHAPALDVDFSARLLPSKTPGHYHLFLDRTMPWWRYRILLKVLAWSGIIEPGYYRASVARKQTFLRKNDST